MEAGIAAFDPNDLICYSPEESEDEDEPPPAALQRPASPLLPPPPPPPKTPTPAIDLAAISGEEIQLTVPSATTAASPLQGARFKCKFCPTYTHTAEEFIKHFIMHFGRNRISYKQMTREEVRALPNANEKFVCGVCARCFEAREAVKEHMIKDHGFKEIKPTEPKKPLESAILAPPTGIVPLSGAKRKLDDDFVDSQKLPISDSSSNSSEAAESKPGSAASSATVSKTSQAANSSKPSAAFAGTTAASAVLPVLCDSETPKSSPIQQQQQQPPSQPTLAITVVQPKLDEAAEDAELNEFLQPMTLKALKLKLLAGLKLKCPQKGCVYKFETRAKRDIHLKCHNIEPVLIGPGGPQPGVGGKDEKKDNFKCYQCNVEFPKWRETAQHLWKQHKIDSNMLKCPVCDVRFEFAVKVYRHLQTHRPVKAYSCPSCGKSFATQSQLSVHEALHKKQLQQQRPKPKPAGASSSAGTSSGTGPDSGPDGKSGDPDAAAGDAEDEDEGEVEGRKPAEKLPWYAERKCDICGHMFSNSKILSKHIKTVHHKIKPFICNVCGYKSARKVTLTIHMRQHSGLKPLECKECPFRTADPSALKYHEKRHSKDKWYECKYCGLLTIQASALKTHIRLNHPKEYETIKCDLCNFTSVNAELLARHKSDHKAGLIKSEDSHDSVSSKRSKNAPESSSDCFLPIESTDSVVHDAGGFTIPAVINAPVAHSEETQFPT